MSPRPISPQLAFALVVLGLVLAIAPAFLASFEICGISGCSGGGFGRSTDPGSTRLLLLAAGVFAALPLTLYALRLRTVRLLGAALLVGVLTIVFTGLVIGSDLQGCPRNVSTSTCQQESRH